MTRMVYQGRILSSLEKNTSDGKTGFCVSVNLMPHCTTCRVDTYKCPHLDGSSCVMTFWMTEKPNGNFLKYYADEKIEIENI